MTSNFSFQVPASLSEGFNAVTAAAVPVYAGDAKTADELMSVADTLKGLAAPGHAKANRAAIYPRDLDEYVDPPPAKDDPYQRRCLDIAEGKWGRGFGFSVLKVEDEGKIGYLYALEDQVYGSMAVVGKQAIDEGLAEELKKNGVTYVQAGTPNAVSQVDDFLSTGVYLRDAAGQKYSGMVIEDLIRGISVICDLGPADGGSNIPMSATVGYVMTKCISQPAAYVSIMKPKF